MPFVIVVDALSEEYTDEPGVAEEVRTLSHTIGPFGTELAAYTYGKANAKLMTDDWTDWSVVRLDAPEAPTETA